MCHVKVRQLNCTLEWTYLYAPGPAMLRNIVKLIDTTVMAVAGAAHLTALTVKSQCPITGLSCKTLPMLVSVSLAHGQSQAGYACLHDWYSQTIATASISTLAFKGSVFTAKQARAGGCSGKYLPVTNQNHIGPYRSSISLKNVVL